MLFRHHDETLESKFLTTHGHKSLISLMSMYLNLIVFRLHFYFNAKKYSHFQTMSLFQIFLIRSIRKKKAFHINCYIGLTWFSTLEKLLGKSHCVYEPFILTPCPQTPGKENNTSCDKNQHNIARACARRARGPAWRLLALLGLCRAGLLRNSPT